MTGKLEKQTLDFTPSPEYLARAKRVQDALELRKPDRIPVLLTMGYLLAEMGKITRQELHENFDKYQEILEKMALHFQPDIISGLYGSPTLSILLGDRMTKWPGYGLGPNGSFQAQLRADKAFDALEALAVDEAAGRLYVISGGSLYGATLPSDF